jgi:hypothetical protein
MNDQQVSRNWRVFLEIAEGKPYSAIRRSHPTLTLSEFSECQKFVENCQDIHRNAWKRWTLTQTALLRRMHREKVPAEKMVEVLGRSRNAIKRRLQFLGLLPPSSGRRAA